MINYLYTHPMLYYYFVHPAICNEVFPLLQRWSRLSLKDVYSQSNISICWFCLILAIHMLPTKYALHYLRCQLKCPVKRVQTTTGYNSTYHPGPLLTHLIYFNVTAQQLLCFQTFMRNIQFATKFSSKLTIIQIYDTIIFKMTCIVNYSFDILTCKNKLKYSQLSDK